jgi:hypothetical protein
VHLVVPVGDGVGRQGEPDVVQGLEQDGADVVGAVLVADDRGDGDLAEGLQPALLVGLGQLGIQPFQDALRDAGVLAHPGRGGDQQDVGVHDLGADAGPGVPVAHVQLHTGLHIVVDDPHHLTGDLVLCEGLQQLFGEQDAARAGR